MDPGAKLGVFIAAGTALAAAAYWLFRRIFPPPPSDPTAPKGLQGHHDESPRT